MDYIERPYLVAREVSAYGEDQDDATSSRLLDAMDCVVRDVLRQ